MAGRVAPAGRPSPLQPASGTVTVALSVLELPHASVTM
jgi:hypothetical protein